MSEIVVVVTTSFEAPSLDRWQRPIDDAVSRRPGRLVIDLRQCPLVDAAAIAVLLRAHRAMVHAGGVLTLRAPTDRVRRILALARLDHVFDVTAADAREAGDSGENATGGAGNTRGRGNLSGSGSVRNEETQDGVYA